MKFTKIYLGALSGAIFFLSFTLYGASHPIKSSKNVRNVAPPKSDSLLNIELEWQVIRSHGRESSMGTRVESFAVKSILAPDISGAWILKILDFKIPVRYSIDPKTSASIVIVERVEILQALKLIPRELSETHLLEQGLKGTVMIPVLNQPWRYLEPIYRSPEEDLYVVKMAIYVPKS